MPKICKALQQQLHMLVSAYATHLSNAAAFMHAVQPVL